MKSIKWINIEKTGMLPSIDETEDWCQVHGHSKRVIVVEDNRHFFGRYVHKLQAWVLEGRSGNLKVTHWAHLNFPKN